MELIGHSLADENGIILTVDRAVADALHRSHWEIAGRSYLEITFAPDRELNRKQIDRIGWNTGPRRIRKRYLRSDGSATLLDVEVSRVSRGLEAGRIIGTLRRPDVDTGAAARKLQRLAYGMLARERRRRSLFGNELGGDTSLILLLLLYVAEAEGHQLDLAEIARTDSIRPYTTERWLRVFEDRGIVEAHGTSGNCKMTPSGIAKVDLFLGNDADW